MIVRGRITNPRSVKAIDETEIAQAIEKGLTITVQFFEPVYTDAMLDHINWLCQRFDERFSVRFFGGISDAALVLRVPDVKSLHLNFPVKNLRSIHDLEHVRELGLSTYNLDELDILASNNLRDVQTLYLDGPKPNSVNLEPLKHYKALRSLYLSEQTRDVEALRHLVSLETLRLRAIKKTRLDFINGMTALKSLEIGLGGRKNLDEVDGRGIEQLLIGDVQGFEAFNNLPSWTDLKVLNIENQMRLQSLCFGGEQRHLRYMRIANCKNLASLKGLKLLQSLDSLRLALTSVDFEELCKDGFPRSLRELNFYTLRRKEDDARRQAIRQMGYETDPDW